MPPSDEAPGPPPPAPRAPHDPFEPEFISDLIEAVWGPMSDRYFRPRLEGLERLPERGPAILVGNHSGTALPYDAMVLDSLIWRRDGMAPEKRLRAVFEKALSFTWWMRPFGIDDFWRRGGGVDMTFDNFDRLMKRGDRVLYFPEGVPGIGKGFQRRYQLQTFRTSFVVMAARHQAPVVPTAIVNAEWVIPFNFTLKWLDRFTSKVFGIPFFPLPAGLLTPIFPFLFYLALPARMVFVVGEPIDVAAMVREARARDPELPERELLVGVAERLRRAMQADLEREVERHGKRPYDLPSLRRELKRSRGRRALMVPFFWPWFFLRHDRDRRRPPAKNRLHALLRDWDVFFYYLPLGWLALALARRFRKPPCGYRGLTREERQEREGAYIWHLKDRPLPPRD